MIAASVCKPLLRAACVGAAVFVHVVAFKSGFKTNDSQDIKYLDFRPIQSVKSLPN